METAPPAPPRLVYLDWLRVAAFGLALRDRPSRPLDPALAAP